MTEAHPDDLLIVAWFQEGRLYPQFKNSQIIPVASPDKLRGRSFRIAWTTPQADIAVNAKIWGRLYGEAFFCDGEVLPISEYKESA